jgi:methylmalonyl-CoA mutase C-terminal domain/subunit
VLLTVGGIIPDKDVPVLLESGVGKIFKSGSPLSEIVDFIRSNVREKGV